MTRFFGSSIQSCGDRRRQCRWPRTELCVPTASSHACMRPPAAAMIHDRPRPHPAGTSLVQRCMDTDNHWRTMRGIKCPNNPYLIIALPLDQKPSPFQNEQCICIYEYAWMDACKRGCSSPECRARIEEERRPGRGSPSLVPQGLVDGAALNLYCSVADD
jgi:hypothetical protein